MSEEKNTNEEAENTEQQDTEGQAFRAGRRSGEGHLPPAQRGVSDDGSEDVEGQAMRSGR